MDRRAEVLLAVGAALALKSPFADDLKAQLRGTLTSDPIDSLAMTVLIGGQLFFNAEKGHNPKVTSLSDALVCVTNSMSGYSGTAPQTEAGKLITAALQAVGPALTIQGLSAPAAKAAKHADDSLDTQRQILAKLDAILTALDKPKT